MHDKRIRWEHINAQQKRCRLFDKYCWLIGCCDVCNKKVRFWCKVKEYLTKRQEKIIRKVLDKRERRSYGERKDNG